MTIEPTPITPEILEELFAEPGETALGTKVLLDNAVIFDFVGAVPGESDKAIIESYVTGPVVVDKSRLQPLA